MTMPGSGAKTGGGPEPTRPLALVTGGLHRIGAAIAARLADAGYDLALHWRTAGDMDPLLTDAIARNGTHSHGFAADLSVGDAGAALVDAVSAHFGRVPSVLVNNASLFGDADWTATDGAALRDHFAVNSIAPVQMAQRIAAAAHQPGAAAAVVINILDQRVRNPVTDQFAYTLSKQALWQATRTMALALAPHVRVNAVAPGLTLASPDYAPGQMARLAEQMPLDRLPTPADIADAVAYLVGAGAVTGQTIFVDGGANLLGFGRDFVNL